MTKKNFVLSTSEPNFIDHLRKFINLPKNLVSLDLHIETNGILTAKAEFYPDPVEKGADDL